MPGGVPDDITGGPGFDGVFYIRFQTPVTATIGVGGIGNDVEKLAGSAVGGDHLTGNDLPNSLFGLGAPSVLSGLGGDDDIHASLGSDVLGGAGDDTVALQGFRARPRARSTAVRDGPLGDSVSFMMPTAVDISLDGPERRGGRGL